MSNSTMQTRTLAARLAACAGVAILVSCAGNADTESTGASQSALNAQPERAVGIQTGVAAPPRTVMSFRTSYGVDGPFIDDTSIRGVKGDELPWTIAGIEGSLDAAGRLRIQVRGLVFSNDDIVPASLRGINDEEKFRALVSCISEGEDGKIHTVNVTTTGFQATQLGDSHIDTTVKLPKACLAPVIFIMAGTEDKWFAVTGVELEGD
jgi:hypothetical protein